MDTEKWKILTASLALICSLTIPVLAYTIYTSPLYPLNTGIVLQGVTMQLGFYWDDECTLPVTTIDFGEIQRSGSESGSEKTIYIRNEGTDAIHIYWNSTLGSVTTAIEDDWWDMGMFMPLNVSSIPAVSHIETRYMIGIHAGVPMGTYNWTVTVWGESYVQTEPPDPDILGVSETKIKLTLLSLLLVLTVLGSSLSLVVVCGSVWKSELYKRTVGLRIEPLIEGDISGDDKVDQLDLEILATAYGSTPTEPNWNLSADINGNKIVEVQDLFVIGANYGKP